MSAGWHGWWVAAGLFILLLWLVAGSLRSGWRGQSHDRERRRMPRALAQGTLVYSEQQFRCESPRRWVARVDQVYRQRDGMHVVVDTKTRRRVQTTASDVIELSVQAMVLRSRLPASQIASWGWVRIQLSDDQVRYRRVALLSDQELIACDQRYRDILAKRRTPAPAAHAGQCRACGFRDRCERRLA